MRLFKTEEGEIFGIFQLIEKLRIRRLWIFSFLTGKMYKIEALNYKEQEVEAN